MVSKCPACGGLVTDTSTDTMMGWECPRCLTRGMMNRQSRRVGNLTIDGKKITGQDLKNALGPDLWDEFCGYVATDITKHVIEEMKNNGRS